MAKNTHWLCTESPEIFPLFSFQAIFSQNNLKEIGKPREREIGLLRAGMLWLQVGWTSGRCDSGKMLVGLGIQTA